MKKLLKTIKQSKKLIALTVIVVLASSFLIFSFARYVIKLFSESYLESKEFYFNSDLLTGKTYELDNWDTLNQYTIPITLFNYEDEIRFTKDDINYNVEVICPSQLDCTFPSTGTITYLGAKVDQAINVNVNKKISATLKSGDKIPVKIKATSTSKYKKVLESTFNFNVKRVGVGYDIVDTYNSLYFTSVISNYAATSQTIKFNWNPIDISIDNLSELIGTSTLTKLNNHYNSIELNLSPGTVYSIKFYKNTPNDQKDIFLNNPFTTS